MRFVEGRELEFPINSKDQRNEDKGKRDRETQLVSQLPDWPFSRRALLTW